MLFKAKDNIPKKVTLKGFIRFVSKKKGPYNYFLGNDCAFAQYLKSVGYTDPSVGGTGYCPESSGGIHSDYYSFHHLHGSLAGAISGKAQDYQNVKHTFEDLKRRLTECCL